MGNNINVCKDNIELREQNEVWLIIKKILLIILWSALITFGVSLLCGFRYDLVVSYSMYPVLTRGSLVVIEPTPYEELEVGDIVNFDFASTTCTHRLVDFAEDGDLITQGDASTSQEKIPRSKYRGTVVAYEHIIGKIILYIREHLVITVLASMLILLGYVLLT